MYITTIGKNYTIGPIYKRSTIIPETLKNKSVIVYKGQEYLDLNINKYMVGYKIGEFAFTRKNYTFPEKKKKKKK